MAKKKGRGGQRRARANRSRGVAKGYTWTIMFYLAGDNNLSDEMVWAIKEVYRVGVPPGVAVTLQFDPLAVDRSTRFFVARASQPSINIDGIFPILHDHKLPELNDGDPDVVVDFIVRSMKEAPAEYYMLILAGHGAGIVGDFLSDSQTRGARRNSLGIPDLGRVLPVLRSKLKTEGLADRQGPIIDVLGLDSCLMSMAEICSEVAGEVAYLVGSEGFDPNTGWPYFRLLENLRAKGAVPGPEDMARLIVDTYVLYYGDYDDAEVSVDMSACDVSRAAVDRIESAVRQLVEIYLTNVSDKFVQAAVVLAHWRAQSFKRELYTDLVDFCFLLQEECRELSKLTGGGPSVYQDLVEACGNVIRQVSEAVKNFTGPQFQHSNGLSVYFPWSRADYVEDYRLARFAVGTRWDTFLEQYVDATRREIRKRQPPAAPAGGRQDLRSVTITNNGELALIESQITRPAIVRAMSGRPRKAASLKSAVALSTGAARPFKAGHRENFPSNRENFPSNRENFPSNRENFPSNRENFPSNRENFPSNRFAQLLGTLVTDLPSTMKNPPTEAEPIVRFTVADVNTVQNFKRNRES